MTVTLLSTPDYTLLPLICTCIICSAQSEVTDYSDFTRVKSAGHDGPIDSIYVKCPACPAGIATPPDSIKTKLTASYEIWKVLSASEPWQNWSKSFLCLQCNNTTSITTKDVKVTNSAVGWGGESWEPKVKIECPVCNSLTLAGPEVPDGIKNRLLSEAESKRK